MNTQWVAVKHPSTAYGQWLVSPKDFFLTYKHIPDCHANIMISGMEEVSDHTYAALDGSDGRELLIQAGLEILDNPVWYFQVPGYVEVE